MAHKSASIFRCILSIMTWLSNGSMIYLRSRYALQTKSSSTIAPSPKIIQPDIFCHVFILLIFFVPQNYWKCHIKPYIVVCKVLELKGKTEILSLFGVILLFQPHFPTFPFCLDCYLMEFAPHQFHKSDKALIFIIGKQFLEHYFSVLTSFRAAIDKV